MDKIVVTNKKKDPILYYYPEPGENIKRRVDELLERGYGEYGIIQIISQEREILPGTYEGDYELMRIKKYIERKKNNF